MERNCIKSVVSFSALGQREHSEGLTKLFVNPRNGREVEMCAIGGRCTAVIVVMLFLSKRAGQAPAAKGRGFAAVFG